MTRVSTHTHAYYIVRGGKDVISGAGICLMEDRVIRQSVIHINPPYIRAFNIICRTRIYMIICGDAAVLVR